MTVGPSTTLPPSSPPTCAAEVPAWLDGNAPLLAATVRRIVVMEGADVARRLRLLLRSPYALESAPYAVQRAAALMNHKQSHVRAAWWGWVSLEVDRAIAGLGGASINNEGPGAATSEPSHTDPGKEGRCL